MRFPKKSPKIPRKIPKKIQEFPKNSQDFENIQFPTSHLEAENPFGLVWCKIMLNLLDINDKQSYNENITCKKELFPNQYVIYLNQIFSTYYMVYLYIL